MEWYKEEEHIGYDISGKKIKKQTRKDRIDSFLAGADDSKSWCVKLFFFFSFFFNLIAMPLLISFDILKKL